jgi:hypothetical protein
MAFARSIGGRRLAGTACACLLAVAAGAAPAAEPIDLEGTWYVLVHYRDPKTANPDAMRWKDLVWVFTRAGTRLEWAEYPIVVFDDTTGRFEAAGGNPRSRVLAAWEPNAEQRAAIDAGPVVNRRGMRVKTLRGSDARGWTSPRRMSAASATVMTYQENLTIEGLDALPRFVREDVIASAISASSGGGTRYEVERIERDGRMLSGRYTRDDRQRGTFRMWRTEPVRNLPEKDEDERREADDGAGDGPSGPLDDPEAGGRP